MEKDMLRMIGTSAMGLRAPIIKRGDKLDDICVDLLIKSSERHNLTIREKDVLAVTESLLARSQGNFCEISEVTQELNEKFGDSIGVLFPITSRNRFSLILKAIADTGKKIHVFLNYPGDEVGNKIIDPKILMDKGINPNIETIGEIRYRDLVGGSYKHPYTGIDYVDLYKSFAVDDNIEIYLSNNPLEILNYTDEVLVTSVHHMDYLTQLLANNGAKTVYSLADIMTEPRNGSGYNPEYGLCGSNMASDHSLKLFPRDSQDFVESVQKKFYDKTGVTIEVLVYGDGAFKDPVSGIWELADPTVAPGFTKGLEGQPSEIKLKYIADNELSDLEVEEAERAMKDKIANKEPNKDLGKLALGTTPRRIPDLLGSLADLVSGSGDKGTPVVLIQGYFDNYADE